MTCLKCPNPTHGRYPHCPACMVALLKAGLCKWCGKEPRKAMAGGHLRKSIFKSYVTKQSEYCEACTMQAHNITQSQRERRNHE